MNNDSADFADFADLADCCPNPSCHPGDHPAVPPTVVVDDGGSLRASYRHEVCGAEWDCWWDAAAAAWPMTSHPEPARSIA
jgi:hypothetical protein